MVKCLIIEKRSKVQCLPILKTDWYFDLIIKNYHQKHKWKNISPLFHPDVFRSFSVALPFLIVRDFYTEYFLLINWMTIRLFLTLGPPCHRSQPSPWLDLLKTYSYDSILINIYKPTPTTQILIIYICKSQKILFHIRSLVRLSPTKEGKRSIVIVCVCVCVEKMSNQGTSQLEDEVDQLPGFRFHPTDEELVAFYLRRKVDKKTISMELIKQIDIYKHDPWDLPSMD